MKKKTNKIDELFMLYLTDKRFRPDWEALNTEFEECYLQRYPKKGGNHGNKD